MERLMGYFSEIVGAIIGLLITGFGLALYQYTVPIRELATERIMQQAILAEQAKFSSFNNVPVSGAQVLTAMRRYSLQDNFYIYVRRNPPNSNFIGNPAKNPTTCLNIDFTTGQLLNSTTPRCTVTVNQMELESSAFYVSHLDRFISRPVLDSSDRVAGLFFDEQ
jgi:hypothetical protein